MYYVSTFYVDYQLFWRLAMQAFSKLVLSVVCSAALAACGGGGSSSSTTANTPGQAQGVYTGSFASAAINPGKFSILILENDEYWTLYGREGSDGQLLVYGLVQGQGAASNGSFTTSDLKDYYYDGTTANGTLIATYQAGATFNGTLSENGRSVSFAGAVPAAGSSTYNYSSAATVSSISGAWTGTNMSGVSSNYTIASNGTFAGTNQYGCGFSGTVTPRPSGKNVFDVSLTNNTSPACGAASGLTGRGIALTTLLGNGSSQLIVAVVTSDRVYGSVIFANR